MIIWDMNTDAKFLHGTYRILKYFLDFNVPIFHYILTYQGQYSFSEFGDVSKIGVCSADDLFYLVDPIFEH